MELKANEELEQLIQVIRQLPEEKISALKKELTPLVAENNTRSVKSFQELLLGGPVMSNEQYKEYKKARNHFNKWRTK